LVGVAGAIKLPGLAVLQITQDQASAGAGRLHGFRLHIGHGGSMVLSRFELFPGAAIITGFVQSAHGFELPEQDMVYLAVAARWVLIPLSGRGRQ
jgi:hypothetical protein